ncbi:hypothetical protein TEA_011554 [Camellia sinensis var. sinensis]|uniref:Peroxidase n=1 Tax=Camellia sinensis var. sinensis TaxID=542762 RepID=A0A4V3WR33_CAMSN|nr:hypothetical protein TEA_011554 [Camellia sinensis var. sinensis]
MGGPYYNVLLGRRDGLVSKSTLVEGNLPRPTMSMTQIINIFSSKGFSIGEMVALSGAHTIGFSHCKEFSTNIYNYTMNPSSMSDPSYNPRFADGLRQACADYHRNPTLSVFNDIMTPNKFDNMYYQNLPRGLGLLASDRGLSSDPRTRTFVEKYAANQTEFFEAFGRAMEKLSVYGVKTGQNGEIRHSCASGSHFPSLSLPQTYFGSVVYEAIKVLRFDAQAIATAYTSYYPHMVGTKNSIYVSVINGIGGTSLTSSHFAKGTPESLMSSLTQIFGSGSLASLASNACTSGSLCISDLFD